jgi:subtilisin family serine protease
MVRNILGILCVGLVLAACQVDRPLTEQPEEQANVVEAALQGPQVPPPEDLAWHDGRADVVVSLRDLEPPNGDDDAARVQRLSQVADRVLAALPPGEWSLLRRYRLVPALAGRVTAHGLAVLRTLPDVTDIQADLLVHSDALPARIVQATAAHKQRRLNGQGVRVAVIDSGVDASHPDLAGRIDAQHCFAQGGCPPLGQSEGKLATDQNGHGTHVASLLLGAGKVAPEGIAPAARLVAVRVLGPKGTGPTSDVLAGLDWLAQQAVPLGVRVLNLSLGGQKTYAGTCDAKDPATAKALQLLRKKGVAVFAAAGNDAALAGLSSPACLSGVTSVGATYSSSYGPQTFPGLCADAKSGTGVMTCFSNRSAGLDLVAPGAFLTGAGLGGGTVVMAGTSQATPIAAGVATLLVGCKPSLGPDALQAVLQQTGKPLLDPASGHVFPLVQALAAAQVACP